MSNNIVLTFVTNYGAYRTGDVAHFPESAANVILGLGAAKMHEPTPAQKLAERPATKSKIVRK